MIYINILTNLRQKLFEKQLPDKLQQQGFVFKINSTEDIVWDLVVVYEDIDEPHSVKYKKGGLLFISGEPPMVRVYSSQFLNQFDHIISAHKGIKHPNNHITQQSLPWYFGYDYVNDKINYTYRDLENLEKPTKTKKISFITSNRTFLPRHNYRKKLCENLQEKFPNEIDFFGKGYNLIGDKADAIIPYYFSICIENSAIEDYWTEKISDVFLGSTVPLYNGCKNINSYFDEKSMILLDIKDEKSVYSQIDYLLQNTEKIYNEHIKYIIDARQQILQKYNLYASIIDFIKKYIRETNEVIKTEIKSSHIFHDKDFANACLKTKRIIIKNINKLLH